MSDGPRAEERRCSNWRLGHLSGQHSRVSGRLSNVFSFFCCCCFLFVFSFYFLFVFFIFCFCFCLFLCFGQCVQNQACEVRTGNPAQCRRSPALAAECLALHRCWVAQHLEGAGGARPPSLKHCSLLLLRILLCCKH